MKYSLVYQSTSKERFNDQYDPQNPIPLQQTFHQFKLSPQSSHWRFGVIFTDSPTFPDKSASNFDRYDFDKFQYFQVNVGVINEANALIHPHFIQLTDMQHPPFYEENDYESLSDVELLLEPNSSNEWQYTCNYQANDQRRSVGG